MGMRVICRYCKSKIEKKDALQIPGEKYNTYYCNQECYSKANAEKKAKEIERLAKKQEKEENKYFIFISMGFLRKSPKLLHDLKIG